MKGACCFALGPVAPLKPVKNSSPRTMASSYRLGSSLPSRASAIKAATATLAYETSTVDYSSLFSVFPAEACEILGGEACLAEMFPEAKLKAESRTRNASSEAFDREYLQYNDAKTVFRAEACDDLGAEFCEPDYQNGL
ncbi:Light-regulated protein 1, chloroplastic [Turnera subulata]|uniref:Light-regulated protein 1, chloroplastic n=1 Tax=Turnera subulata TaxID=218843 RepID=A0A9Q0EYZ2_9ROSI|nr:Light-regulated protein 1, chloroplastic [Turnera subulata]